MIIKVDIREQDLLNQLKYLVENILIFKKLIIKTEVLPIGDIIITNDNDIEKLIIERKSVSDLLASIKDGRYEEQSYRLNGSEHHNHNIIYLIEGDVNRVNRFKSDNRTEKLTLYSAMFSLNYYKGFSVFRSLSLEETATIICNMAYKLDKETLGKHSYYQNKVTTAIVNEDQLGGSNVPNEIGVSSSVNVEQSEKNYVSVIKKVK